MNILDSLKTYAKTNLGDFALAQVSHNYRRIQWALLPRLLDLRNPKRFFEKILWLKLNYHVEGASMLADKIAVRQHVKEVIGEKYLVPVFGFYDRIRDIKIDDLPDRFVIKPNHTSGHVFFGEKRSLDCDKASAICDSWLSIDYFEMSREYQYKSITPKLLVEQDLRAVIGSEDIPDYKFFCSDGEPIFVQVDIGRFSKHRRAFFDMSWRRLPFTILYPLGEVAVPKPACLEDMKRIASLLSKGMPFVRVDLYDVNGQVFFGELTFHPDGGYGPFVPDRYDKEYGKYISIEKFQ